jgi:drug/metabolite transporter (DMT)-like permease
MEPNQPSRSDKIILLLLFILYTTTRSLCSLFFSLSWKNFSPFFFDASFISDGLSFLILLIIYRLRIKYRPQSSTEEQDQKREEETCFKILHLIPWLSTSLLCVSYNLLFGFSIANSDANTFELVRNLCLPVYFFAAHFLLKKIITLEQWIACLFLSLSLVVIMPELTLKLNSATILIPIGFILLSVSLDIAIERMRMLAPNCFLCHIIQLTLLTFILNLLCFFATSSSKIPTISGFGWGYILTKTSSNLFYYAVFGKISLVIFRVGSIPSNAFTLLLSFFLLDKTFNSVSICGILILLLSVYLYRLSTLKLQEERRNARALDYEIKSLLED